MQTEKYAILDLEANCFRVCHQPQLTEQGKELGPRSGICCDPSSDEIHKCQETVCGENADFL